MSGRDGTLAADAFREVSSLHAFFECWFTGACPATSEIFAAVETSLAPSFSMVGPDGRRDKRSDVIAAIRGSHALKARKGPFAIAISDLEILHLEPPLALVGYVEEQTFGNAVTRRKSTALFARSPLGQHGVQWLALHETWIRD